MGLVQRYQEDTTILMEGALGLRLRREYGLPVDGPLGIAPLVRTEEGRQALRELWGQYASVAREAGYPLLVTTPTRRANRERMEQEGEGGSLLYENAAFLRQLNLPGEVYVGGLLGCKGDAYTGEGALSFEEALDFHSWQAERLCRAGVDFLFAGIMPTLPEAAGMAQALADTDLPYIISFTLWRDGRLMDATPLCRVMEAIDRTAPRPPLCYMANCVHPNIVGEALRRPFNRTPQVGARFGGIQANTLCLSYGRLESGEQIAPPTPETFAADMLRLKRQAGLKILGGCCGTDEVYLRAVAQACRAEEGRGR